MLFALYVLGHDILLTLSVVYALKQRNHYKLNDSFKFWLTS